MAEHDFDLLATVVADDVVRTGPYGDTYKGKAAYVEFISGLLPNLPGHRLGVTRLAAVDDGHHVFTEIHETVEVNGAPLVTPEVIVLDLDDAGLIATITIYIQTRGNT
jgi:SnoaL-like domain